MTELIVSLSLLWPATHASGVSQFDMNILDLATGLAGGALKDSAINEILPSSKLNVDIIQPFGCLVPPRFRDLLITLVPTASPSATGTDFITIDVSGRTFSSVKRMRRGVYQAVLIDQIKQEILFRKELTVSGRQQHLFLHAPCR